MNGASDNVLIGSTPVLIRGEKVEVKELTWKDHIRAVEDLTGTILKLLGDAVNSKSGPAKLEITKDKLLEAIRSQTALVSWVLEKSTGKEAAWIDSLSAREVMPLIKAVVDLNLSEEVIAQGKELAVRMGDVFGLKTALQKPSNS